jgi:hypothetical protein
MDKPRPPPDNFAMAPRSLGLALGALGALALASGCKAEDRPGGPGSGGDGTDERSIDAATPDATPPGVLAGTLCALDDLRIPNLCGDADLTDVKIVAQPDAVEGRAEQGGDFAIADAADATLLEIADGDADYHPARLAPAAWRGDDGLLAPIMAEVGWQALLDVLGVIESGGEGSVVVFVVDAGGAPVAGAELDEIIGASNPPRYGGSMATIWLEGATTDSRGAVLVVGVPEGDSDLVVRKGAASTAAVAPVVAGALTFAVVEL